MEQNGNIVLVSGGLDSAVTLAEANTEGETISLHFKYGQLTSEKETKCARNLANHYDNEYIEIELENVFSEFKDGLTNQEVDLSKHYDEEEVATSYVPMRNTIFLSIASGIAENREITNIWYGPNQNDRRGYADCREEYVESIENTVSLGTDRMDFNIHTPLVKMEKPDIVRKGIRQNVPFRYTWSCYQSADKPCGECASCIEREDAFSSAGLEDPIYAY